MGWFEKIGGGNVESMPLSKGLTPPSERELAAGNQSELLRLEHDLEEERRELSDYLAGIYDAADDLGINLDDSYAGAGDESYQTVKQNLLERRARIAMMLEEAEEMLDGLAGLRGKNREVEA